MNWKKDEEGDWQLYSNGNYVGMICPHKEWLQVIVDGRHLTGDESNDLEKNKKWLEKWWGIEQKARKYKESLWRSR